MPGWLDRLLNISPMSKLHYVTISDEKLCDALLPDHDPEDWQTHVRALHLWQCTGLELGAMEPMSSVYSVFQHLSKLANKRLDKFTTEGFLFEIAISRDTDDFIKILPVAYKELGLRPVLPNGILDHLIPILEDQYRFNTVEKGLITKHLLESRIHCRHGDKLPPLSPPYIDLYYAAWGVSHRDYIYEQELLDSFHKFENQSNIICQTLPDVTTPEDMTWLGRA